MNYGQLLETLKNAGPDQSVHLRLPTGSIQIDMAMADETGVYLVYMSDPRAPGEPLNVGQLLASLRAIENQPEFTAQVFGDTPDHATAPVTVAVEENGGLVFDTGVVESVPANRENARIGTTIKHDFESVAPENSGPDGPSANVCVHCDESADADIHQIPVARPLSPPAAGVLNAMGLGMRLRVPHDGSPAILHDGSDRGREDVGPVNPDHVTELTASGHIRKLTRDGEPPVAERTGRNTSWRRGWAEMGLDGDKADFYVMTQ
jgi:hypothetical protein